MASPLEDVPFSADEALQRLMGGNQRFLDDVRRSGAFGGVKLADLVKAQRPYATILGCSDSRVPPELLFDTRLGELFVVRVAGNVISPEVAGSLQYAGSHLRTPLFIVLGHDGCGAIAAAMAAKHKGEKFRARIELLVASILPGIPEFDPQLSADEALSRAVEANVRWTVRQIVESPEVQARKAEGRMKVVGMVYDIKTGGVRLLPSDDATRQPSA